MSVMIGPAPSSCLVSRSARVVSSPRARNSSAWLHNRSLISARRRHRRSLVACTLTVTLVYEALMATGTWPAGLKAALALVVCRPVRRASRWRRSSRRPSTRFAPRCSASGFRSRWGRPPWHRDSTGVSTRSPSAGAAEDGAAMTRRPHRLTPIAMVMLCSALPAPLRSQDVEVAAVVAFTEGPTVDRDGTVYFTELLSQRIMKRDPDGKLSTYREHSNIANGLLIDGQRRLVACEGAPEYGMKGTPRLTRTDLQTGTIESARRQLRRQAVRRPERRDHRWQGPALLHGPAGRSRVPRRRAGTRDPSPRCAGHSAAQRHSDRAG